MDFDCAEKLKRKTSLSRKVTSPTFDLLECDNGEYYGVEEVQNVILKSLDVLCENISDSLESSGFVIPEYVPLMVTGGGIAYIRGAKEHISSRLGMSVQIVSPRVPLLDKPTESGVLSLLDLALEQN